MFDKLPGELKERATAIGNGDSTSFGDMAVDAIQAYNLAEERLKFHPKGRGNGYVLRIGGEKIYIAGDVEAVPEMRALEGVLDFAPAVVFPCHHKGSDIRIE